MLIFNGIPLGRFALWNLQEDLQYKDYSNNKKLIKTSEALDYSKSQLVTDTIALEALLANQKKHTDNLVSLNKGANKNLLSVRTVFPFVLFADTLKIDCQKLTIVHNDLLWVSHTTSIRLKDLRNVQADLGPFFGSITITSKHFLNNTQTINYIRRGDVIKAQRLLQGFMIAHEANIDTDNVDSKQLKSLLNKLGRENI